MRLINCILLCTMLIFTASMSVYALQDRTPHPVLDIEEEKYRASLDLTSESLEDLLALK